MAYLDPVLIPAKAGPGIKSAAKTWLMATVLFGRKMQKGDRISNRRRPEARSSGMH
jgi:hypothetical protein